MSTKGLAVTILSALTTLVVAACASVSGSSPPAVSEPRILQPASSCAGGSLEGCFTRSDMGAFLQQVVPMVERFFAQEYPRIAKPREIVFVATGRTGRSACLDANGGRDGFDSQSYEYCGANRTIYIGQDALWTFYKRFGDAAPVVGLAHEWGHHVQVFLGLPSPRTRAESVSFENQADCFAGAWANYANEQRWLEAQDDLDDIGSLLQAIGSRQNRYRDHGTSAERLQSFQLGFQQGLVACNRSFADTGGAASSAPRPGRFLVHCCSLSQRVAAGLQACTRSSLGPENGQSVISSTKLSFTGLPQM